MDLLSVLQPELHIRALTRRGRLALDENPPADKEKSHHYKISLDGLEELTDVKDDPQKKENGLTLTLFADSHLAPVEIKGPNGLAMASIRRSERSSPFNVETCAAWCGRYVDSDSSSRTYMGVTLAPRDKDRYVREGFLMATIPWEKDGSSFHTEQSLLII
jgi:hypothetical protein